MYQMVEIWKTLSPDFLELTLVFLHIFLDFLNFQKFQNLNSKIIDF
jgi:hypothetical protein